MKNLELELIPISSGKVPTSGLYVIILRGNVDNRGVTKAMVGYYDASGRWYSMANNVITNVTHFAYLPEPKDDSFYTNPKTT